MVDKAFDPKGKTFTQRLTAFLAAAKKDYSLTITKDNGRTKEWQQKFHIFHMFLYNSYQNTKPANTDTGKRTISWSHFSDAKITWNTIKFSDALKTESNSIPQKEGQKWKSGHEPNEEATKRHIKLMQTNAGIGNSGKAMVSSGIKPCEEPCKCGAGRSKHLSSEAADLNSASLTTLTTKLRIAKAGSLDDYLKKFGLHRPLLNHPSSAEKWHVESIK